MQLIQRKTLLYQAGRSEKIYEADLCEIGENRYVVNFRYGKRGGTLKEGSETVSAVPRTEAERIFDRLINAKLQKGYREESEPAPTPIVESVIASPPVEFDSGIDQRRQTVLRYLEREVSVVERGMTRSTAQKRPTNRLIWRAGELQLREAVPYLVRLLGTNSLTNYCIIWALGWCGDESVLPKLQQIYQDASKSEHVRRIALEAIFKLSESERLRIQSELIAQLPSSLRSGSIEALQNYLKEATASQFQVLELMYQIDSDRIRLTLLEALKTAPFRPNYFRYIRHIFKMAEYRRDAEMFSLIATRFEKEKPYEFWQGRNPKTGQYMIRYEDGETVQLQNYQALMQALDPANPNTKVAYRSRTQGYLKRRVWRTLRRLGELEDSDYVWLATSILLHYADADAELPSRRTYHRLDRQTWRRVETSNVEWDSFAKYLTFNHILYENSPRYELKSGTRAWRCKPPYKPGNLPPREREEAFPNLWEQQPSALLKLLLESHCSPVHEFAVKALQNCREFCDGLDLEVLISLLDSEYGNTAAFAFRLARSQYHPNSPNIDLLIAIANCTYEPAREQAHQWILDQRDRFLSNGQLIARLVTSYQPDTRTFAKRLLGNAVLTDENSRSLISRIIAQLLTLETGEISNEVADLMFLCFSPQLRTIGLEIVLDLLRHPAPETQTFGARILLNHDTNVLDLPSGLLDALLESPHDSVRVIGVRLFGQLPDELLLDRTELLLTFATHEIPDMRESIRAAIRRLGEHHSAFRLRLARDVLETLTSPENYEGVHRFLAQLLQLDLSGWIDSANPHITTRLLEVDSTSAQEIAGRILSANSAWAEDWETTAIAHLTHHEVQAIRDAGKTMLQAILPRLRASEEQLLNVVMVFDSKWEDARQFGQQLFSELLQPTELTPSVVISICDSNLEAVRRFGRDLLSRCFQDREGQDYLLKFSEHPATDMQLFATQYLESYAAGHPTRLEELKPYFVRVLAQVNRARVAKQRIFAFLSTEAIRSEAAAQIVAEILTRQSAAIAIGDKSRALETMLKIHRAYPHLALPIQVKSVEVRHGV